MGCSLILFLSLDNAMNRRTSLKSLLLALVSPILSLRKAAEPKGVECPEMFDEYGRPWPPRVTILVRSVQNIEWHRIMWRHVEMTLYRFNGEGPPRLVERIQQGPFGPEMVMSHTAETLKNTGAWQRVLDAEVLTCLYENMRHPVQER